MPCGFIVKGERIQTDLLDYFRFALLVVNCCYIFVLAGLLCLRYGRWGWF